MKSQNEQLAKPMGLVDSMSTRQKYWKELNKDEKIERLRELLKSMVNTNDSLRSELIAIKSHTHDKNGEAVIVKPLKNEYGMNTLGQALMPRNDDEVYI